MHTPNDKELSAYLDGELDAVTAASVEASLAESAMLRARLVALQRVDGLALSVFDRINEQPLPDSVRALFEPAQTALTDTDAEVDNVLAFPRRAWQSGFPLVRIAATVVITATAALFLATQIDQEQSVQPEGAEVAVVDQSLDSEISGLLDTAATGERIELSAGAAAMVSLSFKARNGDLCREMFALTETGTSRGLYCKSGGREWRSVASEVTPASEQASFRLASGDEGSVDAAIEAAGMSARIGAQQEQELIKQGW